MNYLKISNIGEIDVLSLSLLGASSKRGDDSKIGMFGSGNKYALAYLLRHGYEISIYSGTKEIKIGTENQTFREQSFDVITVNGVATSITTEFGKDWVLWQAIREIYCNSIDEGGANMEYVAHPEPKENETHFYIKSRGEVVSFVGDFDNYFSENKQVLFECSYGKILAKSKASSLCLYRKGIRCMESDKMSIYDYDLPHISIDENRLVRYSWEVPAMIWNMVYKCTDKRVIRNVLEACNDTSMIECFSSDFSNPVESYMSVEYIEVLKELTIAPRALSGLISMDEIGSTTIIPSKIFEQAQAIVTNENLPTKFKVHNSEFYVELVPSPLHKATIDKAVEFFKETDYLGVIGYEVTIARFENKEIYGFADFKNQKIVVSEMCIEKGVQSVIETMIEEYIHLKYEVKDETRSFQNAAITEITNLLKIHNAYLV